MSRRRGFTLIELLVVIAIIAILAAILFPVFTTARAAGKTAACQSNMKELLKAATMYEADQNGGLLPGCCDANGDNDFWQGSNQMNEAWTSLIDPYIRQLRKEAEWGTANKTFTLRGVYVCPNKPRSISRQYGTPLPQSLDRTYGYNYIYFGGHPNMTPNNPQKPGHFHKEGEVAKPTKTIRILEIWNFSQNAYNNYTKGCGSMFCYPPTSSYCVSNIVWPAGWHSDRTLVGWYDGHVTTVKLPAPTGPDGDARPAKDYTGILQRYLNGQADPYFRLKHPKP